MSDKKKLQHDDVEEEQNKIAQMSGLSEYSKRKTKLEGGWTYSEYLPEGWKGKNMKGKFKVKTIEGFIFESYRAVAQYMDFSESFIKQDVDLLYLYPDGTSHRPVAKNKRKYIPGGQTRSDEAAEYKTKNIPKEANEHRQTFLVDAPLDNTHCFNKTDHMNDNKEPNQTVDWKSNIYLPDGWLCKKNCKGSKNIQLKSLNGTRLCSYKEAAVYMEVNTYSTSDIEKLYFYPDGRHRSKERCKNKSPYLEQNYRQHLGDQSEIPRIKLLKSKNGTILGRISRKLEKSLWAKSK